MPHHHKPIATVGQQVATLTDLLHSKKKTKRIVMQLLPSHPWNIQVEVAEPEAEGGNAPQENDPQPDGIASSKEADFIKAESEQDLPLIRRPTVM